MFRDKFILPENKIYFLGNSLGLQPKTASTYINEVLAQWAAKGVESFFTGDSPWLNYHDHLIHPLSKIAGAKAFEVVVMNSLTVNLHLLLATFYRPDKHRFKIICEANAFPSDQYMLETHVKHHQLNPSSTIVEIHPRQGEFIIRDEDIEAAIALHADELALVLWGGVNYYTGQVFDIESITRWAHKAGAVAGFDLAHAIGNIKLQLHDWDVDFACWCSYKYLNSGPGGVGGAYIHERYHSDNALPRLAGWWGYDKHSRFQMNKGFVPIHTAEGWQVSTPPITLLAAHKAALEIVMEAGIDNLVEQGKQLSDLLVKEVEEINTAAGDEKIIILTPQGAKGCQLSLMVKDNPQVVFQRLSENGIFADWREPNVIRVAPVPLYNTAEEITTFAAILKKLIA